MENGNGIDLYGTSLWNVDEQTNRWGTPRVPDGGFKLGNHRWVETRTVELSSCFCLARSKWPLKPLMFVVISFFD